MRKKVDKNQVIKEISDIFAKTKGALFLNLSNLSNSVQFTIKEKIKANLGSVKVFKRTLLKRAQPNLDVDFKKPFALIFDYSDDLKAIRSLSGSETKLDFLAGWLNGQRLNPVEANNLVNLPGREELFGRLVYDLQSPLRRLVNLKNNIGLKLVKTLAEVGKKK